MSASIQELRGGLPRGDQGFFSRDFGNLEIGEIEKNTHVFDVECFTWGTVSLLLSRRFVIVFNSMT